MRHELLIITYCLMKREMLKGEFCFLSIPLFCCKRADKYVNRNVKLFVVGNVFNPCHVTTLVNRQHSIL